MKKLLALLFVISFPQMAVAQDLTGRVGESRHDACKSGKHSCINRDVVATDFLRCLPIDNPATFNCQCNGLTNSSVVTGEVTVGFGRKF